MIAIGAPTPSREPLGLLTDCHRRIEAALASMRTAVEGAGELDAARAAALRRARQFFVEMAPKHTQDEEQSLFPRLREKGYRWPELEALEAEHQAAQALHDEIDRALDAWLADGKLPEGDRQKLAESVARLVDLYQSHIRIEDEVIFPQARACLSPDEQEAVRREMVARRAVQIAPFPAMKGH